MYHIVGIDKHETKILNLKFYDVRCLEYEDVILTAYPQYNNFRIIEWTYPEAPRTIKEVKRKVLKK